MRKLVVVSLVAGLSLAVTACGDGGQLAAEGAISSAQSALDAVQAEAVRYVPEQLKGVEASLATVRKTAASGNYTQALSEVQALTPQISALGQAVAQKKTELTGTWTGLSASLPQAVSNIQSRIAMLSKSRQLPSGVTRESLDSAKTGLDSITSQWTAAGASFASGNLADAVAKANEVKARVAGVMTTLGMQVPDALK